MEFRLRVGAVFRFAFRTTTIGSEVDVIPVPPRPRKKIFFSGRKMMKSIHRTPVRRFNVPADIAFCSVSQWWLSNSPLQQEIRRVA
jgi:hypothetical protein